ncbi:hypothetical protein GALMADRAFT_282864 [Galerina marginata CBS 339.88]|uniref:Uncharacterized protein n=1 Tax=Galerina marginata (strain CBS 339.88) TaxID=685588 RepID=A0A067SLT4_GALM3|nr:hypothetical protein GALMADRAFT_282864 [Galerina marginata CBS 339.88]
MDASFKSMRQNLNAVTTMNVEFESGLEAYHWIKRSRFNKGDNENRKLGILLRSPIFDYDVRHAVNGVPSPFGELELVLELLVATSGPGSGHRLLITIKIIVTDCFGADEAIYSKHFGCKCWEAVEKNLCRFSSVNLTLDYVFKKKEDRMNFDKHRLDKLLGMAKESLLRDLVTHHNMHKYRAAERQIVGAIPFLERVANNMPKASKDIKKNNCPITCSPIPLHLSVTKVMSSMHVTPKADRYAVYSIPNGRVDTDDYSVPYRSTLQTFELHLGWKAETLYNLQ